MGRCLALPDPIATDAHPETVSILVPAWNEKKRLGICLESLLELTWPKVEIIVSAGGSDGTFDEALRFVARGVTVVEQRPGQGKQSALREMLLIANGSIVYLTDADCYVPDDTFRSVVSAVASGLADASTGRYMPFREELDHPLVLYRWGIQRADERKRTMWSEGITGANCAVRRFSLESVGKFDSVVNTGTDYHLARQLRDADIGIRYVDSAVETEYGRTPRAFVNQQSRWLRNTLLHGIKFKDRAELKGTGLTLGLNAIILGLPFTWLITRWFRLALWALLSSALVWRRASYAAQASSEVGKAVPASFYAALPFMCLLDAVASVRPIIDVWRRSSRDRW